VDVRAQRISLWITPLFGGILLIAFVAFPGFFPPMSPEMPADQVAAFYLENSAMIRFSMITFNLCAIMLVPFFMTIVIQIKRMALPSQLLAYTYLCGIAGGATLFAIADIFWLIAAFRPGRNPDLILLLNDMAWLIFIAPVGMVVVANLCLALAVFLDARTKPIFPRWVAYFNIATAAAMTPAACAVIFRTGPLAWDGVLSFWLRLGAFAVNVAVMFVVLRAAINRQASEDASAKEPSDDTAAERVGP
jgi:hypothetical protein